MQRKLHVDLFQRCILQKPHLQARGMAEKVHISCDEELANALMPQLTTAS